MSRARCVQPIESIGRFWELAVALKRLRRAGWIDRGVEDPESVADHSWGVALLAWLSSWERDDLDRDRLLLLGLVHDLPEALAGDRTPFDSARDASGRIDPRRFRQSPAYDAEAQRAKREAEVAALEQLLADLPLTLATAVRSAWEEYDRQETREARYVKQIDKLETLLQSRVYRTRQPELVMDSFALGADRDISDQALRRIGRLDDVNG